MEVATGVHALQLTFDLPGRTVVVHPAAIETERGVLLVDTGHPGAVDQIADQLEGTGLDIDDVWGVLLTHHDSDHAGAVAEIVDRTDATVIAPRGEVPYIVGQQRPIKIGDGDERYPPENVDVEIVEDVVFGTDAGEMRVVGTPGHCPDHVSLYFPEERYLVSGDALVSEDGLRGPLERFTPDMDTAAQSVAKLADLDVEGVLCYHGGPVDTGSERIAEIADEMNG